MLNNIYTENSAKGPTSLEKQLTLWLANNSRLAKQLSGQQSPHKVELEEDQIRALKSLGYLQ